MCLDTIIIFLFYIFYLVLYYHAKKEARDIDKEAITIGDYAIYLDNFPKWSTNPDEQITSKKLKKYFKEKFDIEEEDIIEI